MRRQAEPRRASRVCNAARSAKLRRGRGIGQRGRDAEHRRARAPSATPSSGAGRPVPAGLVVARVADDERRCLAAATHRPTNAGARPAHRAAVRPSEPSRGHRRILPDLSAIPEGMASVSADNREEAARRRGSARASAKARGVPVDVGLRGRRRHQRHVVERRQQDAAVERVQVQEALELGVAGGVRLAAVARRSRRERVLGARAEPAARATAAPCAAIAASTPSAHRSPSGDHRRVRLVGEHLGERRAHRGERQRVAGERAADAADVDVVERRRRRRDRCGDVAVMPNAPHGMPPPIACRRSSGRGRSPRLPVQPPGPGRERVRLVDDPAACRARGSARGSASR